MFKLKIWVWGLRKNNNSVTHGFFARFQPQKSKHISTQNILKSFKMMVSRIHGVTLNQRMDTYRISLHNHSNRGCRGKTSSDPRGCSKQKIPWQATIKSSSNTNLSGLYIITFEKTHVRTTKLRKRFLSNPAHLEIVPFPRKTNGSPCLPKGLMGDLWEVARLTKENDPQSGATRFSALGPS